mgnify:FL=1
MQNLKDNATKKIELVCLCSFQVVCVGVGFIVSSSNNGFFVVEVQMTEAPTRRPSPGRFDENDDPVPKICFSFFG